MTDNTNSLNLKAYIIDALRKHPEGLTLRDIAEIVGHHRHTITKYVYELIGAQVIHQRDVGAAKLCYLRESYNGEMKTGESKILKEKGKGQAQLIALFVILLLVPASVIVAQNVTNSSGGLEGMVTSLNITTEEPVDDALTGAQNNTPGIPQNGTETGESDDATIPGPEVSGQNSTEPNASLSDSVGDEDVSASMNRTGNETNGTIPDELPLSNETNLTIPTPNGTIPDMNATNATVPNATVPLANATNVTIPNVTIPTEPTGNVTVINETNETLNVTENATTIDENITVDPEEPEIIVDIMTPERITRGGEVELLAVVDNTGESVAGNVQVEWILPGFLIPINDDVVYECGDIDPHRTCTSSIMVFADGDASLGLDEVRVRVSYVQ